MATATVPAKLIKADGGEFAIHIPAGDSAALRAFLGGCEMVDIVRTGDGILVVDDEGIAKGLPRNERASSMYGGHIAGDALWFTHDGFDVYDAAVKI